MDQPQPAPKLFLSKISTCLEKGGIGSSIKWLLLKLWIRLWIYINNQEFKDRFFQIALTQIRFFSSMYALWKNLWTTLRITSRSVRRDWGGWGVQLRGIWHIHKPHTARTINAMTKSYVHSSNSSPIWFSCAARWFDPLWRPRSVPTFRSME